MARKDIKKYDFTSDQSRIEAAKNGRKGGVASGRARRDKRDLRKVFEALLPLQMKDKKGQPLMSPITGKPMSLLETIATATLQGAIKGGTRHLNVMLDVLGWKAPIVQEVKQTITDDRSLEEMKEQLERLRKFQDTAPEATQEATEATKPDEG